MSNLEACGGRYLFYFLIFVVIWAPLPMGSNAPWPLWFLNGLIFFLAFCCCIQLFRGHLKVSPVLRKAWVPQLLLVCVPVWIWIQTLPTSFQATDTWAAQTRLFQSVAYSSFFTMVLLLVNSRMRVRYLCYAVVLSGVFQATYGGFMTLSGLEYGFFYEKGAYIGKATGTFIARPHLAGYLVLCLAVGIGLLLADMEKHRSGLSAISSAPRAKS